MDPNSKSLNIDQILQEISKLDEFQCDKHKDQEVTHVITEPLDKNELFKPVCSTCDKESQNK
jgi:hypothetical protein